jgi:hypothetical protein
VQPPDEEDLDLFNSQATADYFPVSEHETWNVPNKNVKKKYVDM